MRPVWGRVVTALVGSLVVIWVAFSAPPWDLVLLRGLWWERLGAGLDTGLQDFGDVFVPFDSVERWEVHGLVLVAVFLLSLGISLCAAAGLPLAGVAVVLLGAGVPLTLAEEQAGVVLGALVLAACLWLVAVSRAAWARSAFGGVAVGGVVVVLAAGVAGAGVTPGAAAVGWKDWKLYDRARGQVGVGYVWDANYDGIRFPPNPTTVFRVRGPGRRSLLAGLDARRVRRHPLARVPVRARRPRARAAGCRWTPCCPQPPTTRGGGCRSRSRSWPSAATGFRPQARQSRCRRRR